MKSEQLTTITLHQVYDTASQVEKVCGIAGHVTSPPADQTFPMMICENSENIRVLQTRVAGSRDLPIANSGAPFKRRIDAQKQN